MFNDSCLSAKENANCFSNIYFMSKKTRTKVVPEDTMRIPVRGQQNNENQN